jgi:transposase
MDRACEGDETRQRALDLGRLPVVPPKRNRLTPWEYDRALYRRRNEVERLFRRLLDVMFIGFIHFALIVERLR